MTDLPPPGAGLHDLLAANFSAAAREDIAARIARKLAHPAPARRAKPMTAALIRAVEKAGKKVKEVTRTPDGSVLLTLAEPAATTEIEDLKDLV